MQASKQDSVLQFDTVAAVDLGSNSFHMLVARWHDGEVITVDRMKETVRLASGLDARNRLSEDAQQRALECLGRFGQRLRDLPPGSVRALGTNTLRKARGARRFLQAAEEALGHPVEIIGGREEARLIYLGVAHTLSDDRGQRLVIDIGGGSTEFIIGERFEPQLAESLQLGCVTFSALHFPDGRLTASRFREAELHAQLELQPIVVPYCAQGWQQALGSSGTFLALDRMLHEGGIEKPPGMSLAGLETLRARVIEAGQVDRLNLPGLSEDRRAVIAGGLAVAIGIFKGLGIERLTTSEGALREGVVHDLFGRFHHEDVRARTIHLLRKRFAVDARHAERVVAEAQRLFEPVAKSWRLGEAEADLLSWAAELHEIGLALAHSRYHKHGEYILTHADLPGFSRPEQGDLALLVRVHRRRLVPELFEHLPKGRRRSMIRLVVLLRLAVLLHRSRTDQPVPLRGVKATRREIGIEFEPGWLAAQPLTAADLEHESAQLQVLGFSLKAS
jgi:exopolyphosphatase / guanosine-5'-triphosphate,3'-diphosphate pyrophosphatase